MTGPEIKEKIDMNNLLIEESFTPEFFTLNQVVAKLLNENAKLREQCPHEFENGICKWCGLKEEEINEN